MRTRKVVITSVSVLAAFALLILGILQAIPFGHNPPVIIMGGSIEDQIENQIGSNLEVWAELTNGLEYSAKATSNKSIYTKDVYLNGIESTQPIPAPNGFAIWLYDTLPDGSPQKSPGVEACSDKPSGNGCGATTGDGNTIYINILRNGTAQLERPFSKLYFELHFHSLYPDSLHPDPKCDPKPSGPDTGICDKLSQFSISFGTASTNPPGPPYYQCGGKTTLAGHCSIGFGAVPPDPK